MRYRRVLLNYALCNCHTPAIFLIAAHLIKSCPTTERLKQLLQTSPVVKLLNFPHQYVFILLSQLQPGAHLLCSSVNTKVTKPHVFCGRAITALCSMYIQRIPAYFFSPQLFPVIRATQDCKSRIILRWIKKNFPIITLWINWSLLYADMKVHCVAGIAHEYSGQTVHFESKVNRLALYHYE